MSPSYKIVEKILNQKGKRELLIHEAQQYI